jgi:protein farnesyltransferase/geranylgeranyltransferase type-1 subunit alpha
MKPTTPRSMQLTVPELPEVFNDLEPIPQEEGTNAVCQIAYSADFNAAYDYLRAVLKVDERSERALRLTHLCLTLNSSNYTVWHYRRLCLQALSSAETDADDWNSRIAADLDMAKALGGSNPKNYQLWFHRRDLLEQVCAQDLLNNYLARELENIATVLDDDGKNYHAWSHRQWVIGAVDNDAVWEQELEYCDKLIQEDPRNNSAWNQRWFVCHAGGRVKVLTAENAVKEADYAILGARLDPYNESPWRYLIGVVQEQIQSLKNENDDNNDKVTALLSDYLEKTWAVQQVVSEAGRDPDACSNLISAAIDLLEFKGDASSLERAVELAETLAQTHDPIRCKYWNMRCQQMNQAISELAN